MCLVASLVLLALVALVVGCWLLVFVGVQAKDKALEDQAMRLDTVQQELSQLRTGHNDRLSVALGTQSRCV